VTAGERMSSPPQPVSRPPVPESLLIPLLDTAGEMLRTLEPTEIPPILRPVAEFDLRGLARGAARQQLLRAIDAEPDFRDRAVEQFLARPDVVDTLESWDAGDAFALVSDASDGATLPVLASALYAARPPGWVFGLGVACASFERLRAERQAGDDFRARESQVAGLAESRRRAEAARVSAEQKAEHIERELREERQSRRDRDAQAGQRVAAAERKAAEIEREVAQARTAVEAADARLEREVTRARKVDEEMRDLQRAVKEAEAKMREADAGLPILRRDDLRALVDAADMAQRLATGLSGVADQARRVLQRNSSDDASPPDDPAPAATEAATDSDNDKEEDKKERQPRPRRAHPRVPPGMVDDDPDALDAMLRTPRAVLVVDGYNVSMLAWGHAPPAQQRDRLLSAVSELQLRTRARVILVFDGADVGSVLPPRRPGVRVVFSPEGEEADAVVVRQASDLPVEVPVVVASSDGWVEKHARESGAHVVSSETLLRALRR
jgi:predicted RNA-binding protein with PIN domain